MHISDMGISLIGFKQNDGGHHAMFDRFEMLGNFFWLLPAQLDLSLAENTD